MTKNQQLWLFKTKTWAKFLLVLVAVCLISTPYCVGCFRRAEADAIHRRGLALYYRGQYHQADLEFQKEAQIAPYSSGAYDCWSLALDKEGNVQQAIALYHKALTLNPESSNAHDNLGLALAEQGHQHECLTELQTAAQDGPDDPIAHRDLGTAYFRAGREQEAQQEWHKAAQEGDKVTISFFKKHGEH